MLIQKNSKGGRRAVGKLSVLASATKHFGQGNLMSKAGAPAVTDLLSEISASQTTAIYAYDAQQGKYISYAANEVVYEVEADGTQIVKYQPAATNDLTYSRDLTNAAWTKTGATVTYDQVGLGGEPNTASEVEDNAGAGFEFVSRAETVTNDSNTNIVKIYVKKSASPTAYPGIEVEYTGGTAHKGLQILDVVNGVSKTLNSDPVDSSEVIDGGDFWIWCVGLDNNSTGNTNLNILFYPAVAETYADTSDAASQGLNIVGNVELHLNKTIAEVRALGPIFTTTAAASTDRVVDRTSDNTWINQDKIALFLKGTAKVSTSEASGDIELLSLTTAAGLSYYDATAGAHEATEGTNTASNTVTLTNGSQFIFGLVADKAAGKMQIYDGTDWGAEQTYDGEFVEGAYSELFRNSSYVFLLEEAKFSARSQEAGKTWIEGLAA